MDLLQSADSEAGESESLNVVTDVCGGTTAGVTA